MLLYNSIYWTGGIEWKEHVRWRKMYGQAKAHRWEWIWWILNTLRRPVGLEKTFALHPSSLHFLASVKTNSPQTSPFFSWPPFEFALLSILPPAHAYYGKKTDQHQKSPPIDLDLVPLSVNNTSLLEFTLLIYTTISIFFYIAHGL